MPTTVNGVGTHYYGKSNAQTRSGVCRSCGANTQLTSYDTRLWFVVVYIPLIPLGRKRIIDQCPSCTRHYVADRAQYETMKQTNVSAALAQYNEQPTPQAAVDAHASLLSFHMHDEAQKFRSAILEEHGQDVDLHVAIASHLGQMGRDSEAYVLMEKVLALQPDMPEARVSVARLRMSQGRLGEARELLKFLEKPGAGQSFSLEPLETLAHVYQSQGSHQEAIDLCKFLISELPKIGTIHSFRKFVTVSERALQSTESILPQQSFSLRALLSSKGGQYSNAARRWTYAALILGTVVVIMGAVNEYIRRNRTLIAINDCGPGLQLSIDGGSPAAFPKKMQVNLAEGSHHVKITGDLNEEFDIDMSAGYFQRFFNNPAWVIMAGGGTALIEEKVYYGHHARPSDSTVIFGERFHYIPDVDYCFIAPPHQITVDSKTTGEVTKIHLGLAPDDSQNVVWDALRQHKIVEAMNYGEAQLLANRNNSRLLDAYITVAAAGKQESRADAFLKQGLDRQPLSVAWHRAYQDLAKIDGGEAAAAELYDGKLKAFPRSADLIYLRGRVESDPKKARSYFQKAHEIDSQSAWPCYALAVDAASCGDWQRCHDLCEAALKSLPDYANLQRLWRESQMGLGEYDALERESRTALDTAPNEYRMSRTLDLCEALAAQSKDDEANLVMADWQSKLRSQGQNSQMISFGSLFVHYMTGDFNRLKADMQDTGNAELAGLRLQSLLALGQVQDIIHDESFGEVLQDASNRLCMSLAYSLQGNKDEAAAWREKAAAALEILGADSNRIAALLRSSTAPSQEQVAAISNGANIKAMLAADLAYRFPKQKADYIALGKRLNVGRMPPYQIVRLVLEQAGQ